MRKRRKKKPVGRKSKKKTYPTKAMAKRARRKGQSIYKVKGGYRISK